MKTLIMILMAYSTGITRKMDQSAHQILICSRAMSRSAFFFSGFLTDPSLILQPSHIICGSSSFTCHVSQSAWCHHLSQQRWPSYTSQSSYSSPRDISHSRCSNYLTQPSYSSYISQPSCSSLSHPCWSSYISHLGCSSHLLQPNRGSYIKQSDWSG